MPEVLPEMVTSLDSAFREWCFDQGGDVWLWGCDFPSAECVPFLPYRRLCLVSVSLSSPSRYFLAATSCLSRKLIRSSDGLESELVASYVVSSGACVGGGPFLDRLLIYRCVVKSVASSDADKMQGHAGKRCGISEFPTAS